MQLLFLYSLSALIFINKGKETIIKRTTQVAPSPSSTLTPTQTPINKVVKTIEPTQIKRIYSYVQPQDITYTEKISYYQISGDNESQLRGEIDSKRPVGDDGAYDARTKWYIKWSYPFAKEENSCRTGPLLITTEIEFIYPQWTNQDNASTELKDKWNKYMENLKVHESKHKEFAINGGRQILQALSALSSYPTCEKLDEIANQKGQEILESIRKNDKEYDAATDHGRSQGAVFP